MASRLGHIVLLVFFVLAAMSFAQQVPRAIPQMEDAAVPAHRSEPQVEYAAGNLRVVARQAMLVDVLDAIHLQTGASVSLPAALASQYISIKVGPAPLLDVLTELLETSECNYIVVGTATKPASIRIIVAPKPTEPELAAFAQQAAAAPKSGENVPDTSNVTLPEQPVEAESDSAASASKDAEKADPAVEATKNAEKAGVTADSSKDTEKSSTAAESSKDSEKPSPAADTANQQQSVTAPK